MEFAKLNSDLGKYASTDADLRIQKKDILGITVSSLNKELDAKFNTMITPSTGVTGAIIQDPGYLVDEDGNLQIHYVGKIKAENLTRKQLKELLEKELSPFLKEPIVQVKFLNKKVTILGAVAQPQIIYLTEESIPIVDALVMAGDITQNARVEEIYIIRDTLTSRRITKVDLSRSDFMKSPESILRPNDIVYVKRDITSEQKEEKLRKAQLNISLITSLVSVVVLLITILK